MSGEMVERVARAIATTARFPNFTDEVRDTFLPHARAAIAAMREPTETMRDAGTMADEDQWAGNPPRVWRAMIDAALAETEQERAEEEGMSEWRPIETAPKDGTRILIDRGDKPPIEAFWANPYWVSFVSIADFYGEVWSSPPERWMPIPTQHAAALAEPEQGEGRREV